MFLLNETDNESRRYIFKDVVTAAHLSSFRDRFGRRYDVSNAWGLTSLVWRTTTYHAQRDSVLTIQVSPHHGLCTEKKGLFRMESASVQKTFGSDPNNKTFIGVRFTVLVTA